MFGSLRHSRLRSRRDSPMQNGVTRYFRSPPRCTDDEETPPDRGVKRRTSKSDQRPSSSKRGGTPKKPKMSEEHMNLRKKLRNSVLDEGGIQLQREMEECKEQNTILIKDLRETKTQLDVVRKGRADHRRRADAAEKQVEELLKEKAAIQKALDAKESQNRLLTNDLKSLRARAQRSNAPKHPDPPQAAAQPGPDFMEEIFSNLRETFDTNLTCSICTEILIVPTSIDCGHTFCSICINQWEVQNPTCPVCRAQIKSKHPTKVLDEYIEKFVGQYFKEEEKTARKAVVEERQKMPAPRQPPPPPARSVHEVWSSTNQEIIVRMMMRQIHHGHPSRLRVFTQPETSSDSDESDHDYLARPDLALQSSSSSSSDSSPRSLRRRLLDVSRILEISDDEEDRNSRQNETVVIDDNDDVVIDDDDNDDQVSTASEISVNAFESTVAEPDQEDENALSEEERNTVPDSDDENDDSVTDGVHNYGSEVSNDANDNDSTFAVEGSDGDSSSDDDENLSSWRLAESDDNQDQDSSFSHSSEGAVFSSTFEETDED